MKAKAHSIGNKGLSLIEVIVTVLIIGIASTIVVLSVSYANRSNANHCAKKLSSLLDLTRTEAMGMVQGTVALRLVKKSDGYEAVIVKKNLVDNTKFVIDSEDIGNTSLTIYYKDVSGEHELLTGESEAIEFEFIKNSGAFKSNYTSIKIVGSKTATVVLVTETGRNYIN